MYLSGYAHPPYSFFFFFLYQHTPVRWPPSALNIYKGHCSFSSHLLHVSLEVNHETIVQVPFSCSLASVYAASVVFIDKIWPQKSILENQSFLAASMALASGVLLYSSLAVLLPEAVERLDDSYLVYVGFFGGALFTLILTKVIHWCTPNAVHACGGSPSMDQQGDEESGHCSSSSSTTSNHDEDDGHTSAGSRTLAYTERHSIKNHPISTHGSTQYGTTMGGVPFSEAHFRIHSLTTGGQQQHHHHHHHDHGSDNHNHHKNDDSSEDTHGFLRIGIQTAVAIGVHKFPGKSRIKFGVQTLHY